MQGVRRFVADYNILEKMVNPQLLKQSTRNQTHYNILEKMVNPQQ